jgi:hypothetical protein
MNNGVIIAVYTPPNVRKLSDTGVNASNTAIDWNAYYDSLKDPQKVLDDERDLQVSSFLTTQVLVFESCLFLNNSHGPDTGSPEVEDGIITALPYNDIVLKSCIFQDNKYSQPQKGVSRRYYPHRRYISYR